MAPVIAAGSSSAFDRVGFWSPHTASVDWCESNYVVSFYIAEYVTGDSTGLGSTLFHGTLRHKMQLLDELPMLYSATMILFILVEAKHGPQGKWFPIALATWIATTTVIFSAAADQLQFYTFQTTYTTLQFGMIYLLRDLHVQQRALHGPHPALSMLIRRAFASGFLAVTLWLIDLRLCEWVNGVSSRSFLKWNPQLHAWWHVFSACALYHATMMIVYYHFDVKGQRPYVDQVFGCIPVIRLFHPKGKLAR
ncbi:hypothetical protein KVV02_005890 [Mortierella alpina]|uniref:Alkaline ceramidase 3 n=1 Tax=Mortierella alpina TaxID=64518 RepID=A0A9P7ZYX2_MORAP|nr:hypothetical protein KVV02_005890 [Mortierella alpina]